MIFLDTSVLIPVGQATHVHHTRSRALFSTLTKHNTATSTHALAELYASLTAVPRPARVSPLDASATAEILLERLTPVSLSPEEYIGTLKSAAKRGHTSGMIFDALHLACARKINASTIYTWNLKHFHSLAPDLVERIITP